MSQYAFTNSKIYVGQYDLTGDMNAVALRVAVDMLDVTVFGNDTHVSKPGLKNVTCQLDGFVNALATAKGSDDAMFATWGIASVPVLIVPQYSADGDIGFAFKAAEASYSPGGAHGEMLKFSVSMEGDGDLIKGRSLVAPAMRTSSTVTVALQLGAVSATQKVYAGLHIFDKQGTSPTLDVKIQSDNLVGMGSPADVITFTQATAEGWQWATPVSGALTDDWWRVSWTIGGSSTPGFNFAVFLGIQ